MSISVRMKRAAAVAAPAVALVCFLATPTPALASPEEKGGPGWELTARTFPTNLPPGHSGTVEIDVVNIGEAASSGPITVTDTLPPGVTATDAGELENPKEDAQPNLAHERWDCTGNGSGSAPGLAGATTVTCTNEPSGFSFPGGGGGPNEPFGEGPNLEPEIGIAVTAGAGEIAKASAEAAPNRVTIAGGGAPTTASTTDPMPISVTPAGFEFTNWDGWFSNADGTLDTQAGSHPYVATFSFDLATEVTYRLQPAGGEIRDLAVDLPPGFVGNPDALPQCTRQQLNNKACPNAAQVGIITLSIAGGGGLIRERLFNMVPPSGVAAEFAFSYQPGLNSYLDASVRSGSDYGITTSADDTPQRATVRAVTTLWGVPGAPSHLIWRSVLTGGCSEEAIDNDTPEYEQICKPTGSPPEPFLTLPTSCGAPLTFTIRADTWEHPNTWAERKFTWNDSNGNPVGLSGCGNLGFGPTITTAPDTAQADTPTGLTVEVKPPLGGLEDPDGVGSSDIENTTVTLPEGLVINPGQAAGLQACQPSQDGLTTEAERAEGKEDNGPPACPNASKVGTVTIKSPLIEGAAEKQFEGNVYVLQSNPPEVKLLVAASADGVNLKLVGVVHLDEQTGRLTTKFEGTPELPFTVFKLSFSGGPQAALDTPTQCGLYTAEADFTPWSSPFIEDFFTDARFALDEGPQASACPSSPMPFAPSLTAGSTTDQAGGFTSFSMLLQREDGQQRIERLQFKAPPGLAGMIASVPLCGEPQAAQGACPASSHIGHTVVTSGPGPYPLVIPQPGEPEAGIYLTGPYEGAPFGLSIVTPVIAGPFNLGTIVTRAKIEIDPRTAQVTVTTDPLPQIVKGVPTDLRSVDAVIDRSGFMFNPTNCEPSSFSGTAWGTPPPGAGGPGASAALSSHFGVGSCRSLEFKPSFTVTTKARASKADGASLSFKISYPKGAQGNEAWFDEAKFDIPKQLPARLETLRQACLATTFEHNRGACPTGSIIGHAVVHTPVLPVALEGPVYFVSYGSAKFPSAVLVLSGDNVNIELQGETFIDNRTGVTSATFRDTPDVPFESIEVTVPTGPYSEFGANLPVKDDYDFCGQKLVMPTLFKSQNGLEIRQDTPVIVSGCTTAKPMRRKKDKRGKSGKGKR